VLNDQCSFGALLGECEMVASLRGREAGNRGTFTVGRHYQAAQ
jgi:hypothetical protein